MPNKCLIKCMTFLLLSLISNALMAQKNEIAKEKWQPNALSRSKMYRDRMANKAAINECLTDMKTIKRVPVLFLCIGVYSNSRTT
jgi:hypothetical protein